MRKYNFLRKPYSSLSILTLCGCFFLSLIFLQPESPLPSKETPQQLYISPFKHNLKTVMLQAIGGASKSISLTTYNLTDKDIITSLKRAAQRGVGVRILTDYKNQEKLLATFPFEVDVAFGNTPGLMHEKILIIDEASIYFSTANMTTPSLCLHENMCLGVYSPDLAKNVAQEKCNTLYSGETFFHRNPDVTRFLQYLSEAKANLTCFIFTITHPDVKELLAKQAQKGIKTRLFIDHGNHPFKIPSQKQTQGPMLHHKCALIDGTTLLLGSANWTKAAFSKNRDYFIVTKLSNKNKILLDSYINYFHCVIP